MLFFLLKVALYLGMLLQCLVCGLLLLHGLLLFNVPILTDMSHGSGVSWMLAPFALVLAATCFLLLFVDLAFSPPAFRRKSLIAAAALNAAISCTALALCAAALPEPKHSALAAFLALLNLILLGLVTIPSWHTAIFRKAKTNRSISSK